MICDLHVGFPKTGTTSLQALLAANRGRLGSVLVNHDDAVLRPLRAACLGFEKRRDGASGRTIAAEMRRLLDGVRGDRVVISSEILCGPIPSPKRQGAVYATAAESLQWMQEGVGDRVSGRNGPWDRAIGGMDASFGAKSWAWPQGGGGSDRALGAGSAGLSAADPCPADHLALAIGPGRRSMTARNLTGETAMRVMGLVAVALMLAACDASELADKAMRRAAETVVEPVVDDYLPGDQAQVATHCIIENANSADLRALVHDVGVSAGTSTVANVLGIAARPETQACLLREGLPTLLEGF